jgi:hypothetical protein
LTESLVAEDVDAEVLAPFVLACDQYPYHELVAYACGHTIGELRDWLERGATAGDDTPTLRDFARDYCRKDAEYARRIFAVIESSCIEGTKAQLAPLWKWFDTRWPCGSPLAITTLLASAQAEERSLDSNFEDPDQDVREALRRTNWFHADELDNPSAELEALLRERGYRRDDALAAPSPVPEG